MRALGREPQIPDCWFWVFSWESRPADRWPPLPEVIRHLEAQRERLGRLIGALTDEQLGCPSAADPRHTVRRSILLGLHDEVCHCGEACLRLKMLRTAGRWINAPIEEDDPMARLVAVPPVHRRWRSASSSSNHPDYPLDVSTRSPNPRRGERYSRSMPPLGAGSPSSRWVASTPCVTPWGVTTGTGISASITQDDNPASTSFLRNGRNTSLKNPPIL